MMELPIMEYFYSVQGEGVYTGHPAFFIRLGGCDVGCVWCDVKESWDADAHPRMTVGQLVDEAQKHPSRIVIVTGGEPAMYDLTELCDALHEGGFRVHLETSGAHPVRGDFDWVTFSPKKFKPALPEVSKLAHELKIVVFNKHDLTWAEQYQRTVSESCALYLQPEWDRRETMHDLIINYVLDHPEWRISLQTHKYLGVD